MRGEDAIGRDAVFDPVLQRAERIEEVRPRPADAVLHTRHQKQTNVLLQLVITAFRDRYEILVPLDCAKGRQRRIAEAMKDEELLVLGDKMPKLAWLVAVTRLRSAVEERERRIAHYPRLTDGKVPQVEGGIARHDELHDVINELPGYRSGAEAGAAPGLVRREVGRRHEPCGPKVHSGAVQVAHRRARVHEAAVLVAQGAKVALESIGLLRRQAVCAAPVLADQGVGVERALSGVLDQAVLNAIGGITARVDRLVNHG